MENETYDQNFVNPSHVTLIIPRLLERKRQEIKKHLSIYLHLERTFKPFYHLLHSLCEVTFSCPVPISSLLQSLTVHIIVNSTNDTHVFHFTIINTKAYAFSFEYLTTL